MSIILAILEAEIRRTAVRSQPKQIVHETLSQKYTQKKGGLAECLPCKRETPSSNPSTAKNKKTKNKLTHKTGSV
jgi:hypothetical protein